MGDVYVEPCRSSPAPPWVFPRSAERRPRRRPGRRRRRPGAGHPARGLPPWVLPDARRRVRRPDALVLARYAAGVLPLDGLVVSRSLRRSCRDFEIRVDTAFDGGRAGCADPRRRTAGSPATSRRRTCGSTSSGGRTRSRRGATAALGAGCTASRSAACSRGSRCSTGSGTPRRSRWSGWSSCCPTARRGPAARRAVGAPHLASLGVVEVPRPAYLGRLRTRSAADPPRGRTVAEAALLPERAPALRVEGGRRREPDPGTHEARTGRGHPGLVAGGRRLRRRRGTAGAAREPPSKADSAGPARPSRRRPGLSGVEDKVGELEKAANGSRTPARPKASRTTPRRGSELTLDAVDDLDDDATAEEMENIEGDFSEEKQKTTVHRHLERLPARPRRRSTVRCRHETAVAAGLRPPTAARWRRQPRSSVGDSGRADVPREVRRRLSDLAAYIRTLKAACGQVHGVRPRRDAAEAEEGFDLTIERTRPRDDATQQTSRSSATQQRTSASARGYTRGLPDRPPQRVRPPAAAGRSR